MIIKVVVIVGSLVMVALAKCNVFNDFIFRNNTIYDRRMVPLFLIIRITLIGQPTFVISLLLRTIRL